MAEAKVISQEDKIVIAAALDMLMTSHKRAESQMRKTNRTAVADAIKIEIGKVADVARRLDLVL